MKPKKLLSFMLAAAMTISLLPTFTLTASATETQTTTTEKNIMLGATALSGYDSTNNKYEYIYYGTYDNEPLKWRILSMNGNDGRYFDAIGLMSSDSSKLTDGTIYGEYDCQIYLAKSDRLHPERSVTPLLLLSENAFNQLQYDTDGTINSGQTYVSDWRYSDAWAWCNDTTDSTSFISSSFTDLEKSHIMKTSKANSLSNGYTDELKGDAFFFLSKSEAENDYIKNDRKAYRISDNNSAACWLRSPSADSCVNYVTPDGNISSSAVDSTDISARPAFNLSPGLLFSSAAVGGKATDNVGTLKLNTANTTNEYKLTMKDRWREFSATPSEASTFAGGKVTIDYSGAVVADNEYISALILDDAQNVLYYGQLTNSTSSSGTTTLNVPKELPHGNYTVRIFNEQINGDKMTDFASNFVEVTLTVEPSKNITLGTSVLSGYNSTTKKCDFIYYGIYGVDPIKWTILSLEGNDGRYFDNTPYTPTTPPTNPEDGKEYTDTNGIKFVYLAASDQYYKQSSAAPLFLLSEYALKQLQYDTDGAKNSGQAYVSDWRYSDAWAWFNDTNDSTAFISTSFTDSEKKHFLKTSKANSIAKDYTDELKGDTFFFLSKSEVESDYIKNDKKAYPLNDDLGTLWWLRSPIGGNCVSCVTPDGDFDYLMVDNTEPVSRPAFNLNQSSVLFTCAAVDGKKTDNVGKLKANTTNATYEWKLTMKDDDRGFAIVPSAASTFAGSSVDIDYSGAEFADNEYISAMILDDDQNVLYYGQLKNNNVSTSGTITINVPQELLPGKYTVQIFNEQINGDKKTDYSSAFQTLSLTVEAEKNIMLGTAALSGYDTVNKKYDYIYYGTYKNEPFKWRILTMNGNGGAYKDSNGTPVASSKAMLLLSDYELLDRTPFEAASDSDDGDGQNYPSDWRYSDAWYWCNDTSNSESFISSSFTDLEKKYFLKTSKANSAGEDCTDELKDDTFFFLSDSESKEDYIKNETFAYPIEGSWRNGWWLRTPYGYDWGGGIGHNGNLISWNVGDNKFAYLPACNFNQSDILFTSAAVGGKNTDDVGTLKANTTNATRENKLTMVESTHDSFRITDPDDVQATNIAKYSLPGGSVALKYENAVTGDNEYISAMIVNDKKKVLYYGQLESARSGKVDVSINLPSDIDYGRYELLLFNEQINGDKKTDYSSAFQAVTLNVKKMPTANDFTLTLPSNLTYDGNAKEAKVVSDTDGMGAATVKYYDASTNLLAAAPTDVGTYIVKIDVGEGAEYCAATDLGDNSWIFTITKADVTVSGSDVAVTYGERLVLTATVEKTTSPARSIEDNKVEFWLVDDGGEEFLGVVDVVYTNAVSGTATLEIDTTDKALKPGENSITAVYSGNVNLNGSKDDTITVALNQKEVGLTWSGYETRIYDGKQSLVKAAATNVEGCDEISVVVSDGDQKNANPNGMFYVATATALTGDASAYYKLPSNAIQIYKIEPKSIENAVLAIDKELTYNGSEQTQNVTLTLVGFTDVTFDASDNKQTNVKTDGDYTLTVMGTGNFEGTKTLDWNIKPYIPKENPDMKTTARVKRGETLAEAAVTVGEILGLNNKVLKGTFAWTNGTKTISADGSEQMTFTPTDTNYAQITLDVLVSTYSSGNSGEASQCTVTFDCGDENTFTTVIDRNTAVSEPASAPVRDNYYFGGWYIGDTPFDFTNTISKDTIITAKWLDKGKFGISITPSKIYIVSGNTIAKAYSAAYLDEKLMDVKVKNIISYEVIHLDNMDLDTTNADTISLFVWNDNLLPLCNKISLSIQ